jgi:hypothetical protein
MKASNGSRLLYMSRPENQCFYAKSQKVHVYRRQVENWKFKCLMGSRKTCVVLFTASQSRSSPMYVLNQEKISIYSEFNNVSSTPNMKVRSSWYPLRTIPHDHHHPLAFPKSQSDAVLIVSNTTVSKTSLKCKKWDYKSSRDLFCDRRASGRS